MWVSGKSMQIFNHRAWRSPILPFFSIRLLPQRRRQTAKAVPHDAKRLNRLPCNGITRLESAAQRTSFDACGIPSEARKVIQYYGEEAGHAATVGALSRRFRRRDAACILRKRLHNANRIVAGHTEADDRGKQVDAVSFPARGCPAGQCSINRRAPRKRRSDSGGEASRSPGRFRILYRTCS